MEQIIDKKGWHSYPFFLNQIDEFLYQLRQGITRDTTAKNQLFVIHKGSS